MNNDPITVLGNLFVRDLGYNDNEIWIEQLGELSAWESNNIRIVRINWFDSKNVTWGVYHKITPRKLLNNIATHISPENALSAFLSEIKDLSAIVHDASFIKNNK